MNFVTLVVWAAAAAAAAPQTAAKTTVAYVSKFGIEDNSFLVEEAINQERGVVQNIFAVTRSHTGEWNGTFTQEWPLRGQRHQFSYTVPFSRANGTSDIGDVMINYRLQVKQPLPGVPGFSPRLSWSRSAWQVNLPVSYETGYLYYHANAGNTWADGHATPFVAGSVIVAARPMFNVMLEVYNEWRPSDGGHTHATTVSPGVRGGWNLGEAQLIFGVAAPVTRGAVRDHAVLGYVSYELPFTKKR